MAMLVGVQIEDLDREEIGHCPQLIHDVPETPEAMQALVDQWTREIKELFPDRPNIRINMVLHLASNNVIYTHPDILPG